MPNECWQSDVTRDPLTDGTDTEILSWIDGHPPAGSESLRDPAIEPYLTQYAGQQLVNGDQAKA